MPPKKTTTQGTANRKPGGRGKATSKDAKEHAEEQTELPKEAKDRLQQDNGKLKAEAEHRQQENVKLQEEKDKLQQDNEKLKEENDQLQKDKEKLKSEKEQLLQENDSLKVEMKKLQENRQKYEKMKEENVQLRLASATLKSDKEQFLQENDQLQKDKEKLKEENVQLRLASATLKEENVQLRLASATLKSPPNTKQPDLENKYEQLLGHLMGRDTESQEKLNDAFRPSQVAERWRTFKNQVYFMSYQDLDDKIKDKTKSRRVLKDMCQQIYEHHRKKEDDFERVFHDQLTPIFQGKDAEKDLAKVLPKVMKSDPFKLSSKVTKEVQDKVVEAYKGSRTFLADMRTQVLGAIKDRWKKAESQGTPEPNVKDLFPKKSESLLYSDTCRDYITECHALCRLMMMQVPSIHLSFDAGQGSKFNRGHFEVHDGPDAGEITLEQVVLPALLRSQGGKVMEKGLATVRE